MSRITREQVQLDNPDKPISDEEFKPVCGFERCYMVSNYGNLISLHPEHYGEYLDFGGVGKDGTGYKSIMLYDGEHRKSMSLHRLVALAFIPNPENKPTVNHIDGNKLNCYVGNLEWATYAENNQHALATGLRIINTELSAKNCRLMRRNPVVILETGEVFETCTDCDAYLNQPDGYVSHAISRTRGFGSTLKLHFKHITIPEYEAWCAGELKFPPQTFTDSEYLNRGRSHRSICVRIIETGECFAKGTDCDRKYNLTKGTTSDIIHRRNGYYPKLDLHFETISKEAYLTWKSNPIVKEPTPNTDEQFYATSNRYRFCVKVIETGECFPTGSECDRHYGFSKGFTALTISKYGGHRKRASAYHFVKITAEEYLEYVRSKNK